MHVDDAFGRHQPTVDEVADGQGKCVWIKAECHRVSSVSA